MELAMLEASAAHLRWHLELVRMRIRNLTGYDPTTEAGLP
jgi:hypothetical protein